MKRTVLTCALSIVACSTQARHMKQSSGISDPYLAAIHNGIVGKQLHATTTAKTTAVQYRYIASAYRSDNQLRDTTHFYYSGFRGSSHPTAFDYTDQYEVTAMDSRQRIKSDSSVAWAVSPNGTKNLYLHKQFVYDNDDRAILQKNSGTNYFVENHAAYESNGNFKHIIQRDTFGGSGLIDKFKHYYAYNTQNKVILDSLVSSVINTGMAKATFTYDANGNTLTVDRYNLAGSTWNHNSHLEYTYDANNRILAYEYSYDNGGGMAPTTKYIYTYTGSAAQFTYQEYSYWDNNINGWMPIESYHYTLNTAGYIDEFYIREYNGLTTGWDTLERDQYTYHSDNRRLQTHHCSTYTPTRYQTC